MPRIQWSVEFHPKCEIWADELEQADAEAFLAAIRVLRDEGPALGRPLADTVEASRHPNMKDLRPGSTGRTEVRVLFAFDKKRKAILPVGGDKRADWTGWYTRNIPIARTIGSTSIRQRWQMKSPLTAGVRVEEQQFKGKGTTMNMKEWEKKVLDSPSAADRVAEIEEELRLAAGLTALREEAGLSQRELAKRIGISQPRIAAIEQSRNVTIDVLDQYVSAVGGKLEVTVVKGHRKTPLLGGVRHSVKTAAKRSPKSPASK